MKIEGGIILIVYKTDILKETMAKPTKLDFERVAYRRSLYPSKQAYFSLTNEEAGEQGEEIVFKYLEKYGFDDWIVIKNMWLDYDGQFEGDLILLTNHGPYLFEVKNYQTDYKYENGVSTWNGNRYSGNPINQTIRNKINLENILAKTKVQGVLALVGLNSYVEIYPEVTEIDIVQRAGLKHYIQKIVEQEIEHEGQFLNRDQLLRALERYEIQPLQKPIPLTESQMKQLRKGIYCLNCKSYAVKIGRTKVACACGFMEERDMAILRTICEYGVLTFDRDIKIGGLIDFFGATISHVSIRKVLKKYFVEKGRGRYTTYTNKPLPFSKVIQELNISSTIKMTTDYESFYRCKESERSWLL